MGHWLDDEIKRMDLHEDLEKDRLIVASYEVGLKHYHRAIEEKRYQIGRLDERLG